MENNEYNVEEELAKLNSKQRAFVLEWHKNGNNGTRAYMKVYNIKKEGTAAASAQRLLRSGKISRITSELAKRVTEQAIKEIVADRAYVAKNYVDVVENSKQIITIEKYGKSLEVMIEPNAAIRANDGLARILGLNSEERMIKGEIRYVQIEELPDSELEKVGE